MAAERCAMALALAGQASYGPASKLSPRSGNGRTGGRLPKCSNGDPTCLFMQGGIDNPLGARALYLGSSLYRIHGSNEPWTIGTNVSSGCIRMRNEDVTDLYQRVKVGTKVVVI